MNFISILCCQLYFIVLRMLTVDGYSSGAPKQACFDGEPQHELEVSQDLATCPYQVTASDCDYSDGKEIKISIVGNNYHRGFFTRAMDKETGKPIGSFRNTEEAAPIDDCSACTHTNPNKKFNTVLKWKYSGNSSGYVYFNSTIVQDYAEFWVGYVTQKKH